MADVSNIYVSIKRVTRESGFTERHVLNVVSLLRTNDLLIPTEERPGKSTVYQLDLARLAEVEPEQREKGRWRGDAREEPLERDLDPERPKLSVVPKVEPESDEVASADEVYKLATGGARP